jgi:hypothetical protein
MKNPTVGFGQKCRLYPVAIRKGESLDELMTNILKRSREYWRS